MRTFSTPWSYKNLELRDPIVPNPFSQLYGADQSVETLIADNMDEVKKLTIWLKDFPNLRLYEKINMINTLEKCQQNCGAIKLIINQKIGRAHV